VEGTIFMGWCVVAMAVPLFEKRLGMSVFNGNNNNIFGRNQIGNDIGVMSNF
jgi:hypothetical protein